MSQEGLDGAVLALRQDLRKLRLENVDYFSLVRVIREFIWLQQECFSPYKIVAFSSKKKIA